MAAAVVWQALLSRKMALTSLYHIQALRANLPPIRISHIFRVCLCYVTLWASRGTVRGREELEPIADLHCANWTWLVDDHERPMADCTDKTELRRAPF